MLIVCLIDCNHYLVLHCAFHWGIHMLTHLSLQMSSYFLLSFVRARAQVFKPGPRPVQ